MNKVQPHNCNLHCKFVDVWAADSHIHFLARQEITQRIHYKNLQLTHCIYQLPW